MNDKARRQIISFLLTFLLVFELIPAWVFADDGESAQDEETYTDEEEYSDPDGELTEDSLSDEETLEDESIEPENEDPESGDITDDDIIVEEFANNTASSEKAEIVEEITGRRDEFLKEFMLENGMHLATIYPMSVHYDNGGKWDEIDNTLVLKEKDESTSYHNTAGLWDVSLPTVFDSDGEITLDHDGYKLSFRFAGEIADMEDQGRNEDEGDGVYLDEDDNTEADFSDTDEAEDEEEQQDGAEEPAETPEEETQDDQDSEDSEETDTDLTGDDSETEEEPAEGEDSEETEPEDQIRNIYIGAEEYELRPAGKTEGIVSDEKENQNTRTGSLSEEILSTIYSSISYYEVFEKQI